MADIKVADRWFFVVSIDKIKTRSQYWVKTQINGKIYCYRATYYIVRKFKTMYKRRYYRYSGRALKYLKNHAQECRRWNGTLAA